MSDSLKVFFDPKTFTLSYLVNNPKTKDAIFIDPVLDYDRSSSSYSTNSIDKYLKYIKEHDFKVHYILETHVHADHLSGAYFLREKLKTPLLTISEDIRSIQSYFKRYYNLSDFDEDEKVFDLYLTDGEELKAGDLKVKAIKTPGHTKACMTYQVEEKLFTGDALFMPDYGTGRCDFPGGDPRELYDSITEKIFSFPDHYECYSGHDYLPDGRPLQYQSTVGNQKFENIHLNEKTKREDYISFRKKRDKTLSHPKLFHQSLQINIRGGKLPVSESNQINYIKVPIIKNTED